MWGVISVPTSPTSFSLSRPEGNQRIPKGTFSYFHSRNGHRIYDLVIDAFLKSGLTQAALARRMGKGTDQICRLLGAPGNWELNTVSDLIFAITGGEVEYSIGYPLDQPPRNMRRPDWADVPPIEVTKGTAAGAPKIDNFIRIPVE